MAKEINPDQSPFRRALEEMAAAASAVASKRGSNANKEEDWTPTFLTAIMEGKSVTDATAAAGVDITLPYKRRRGDKAFRLAWCEAADIGTRLLEQEAARRAYHGTLEPVFYQGEEVGHVRRYSDVLLMFLLKARNPAKYRDGVDVEGRGAFQLNINVVTVEGGSEPPQGVLIETVPSAGSEPNGRGLRQAEAIPRQ